MSVQDKDDELKGEKLLLELSKYANRVGRESAKKDNSIERKVELSIAIGLLNHAQGLAGTHDSRARRLLTSVQRLI